MYRITSSVANIFAITEDLRVEWAKSLARAERWEEEVLMLKVEMNRILVFMLEKAAWWRRAALARVNIPLDVHHGIIAYAQKQAFIGEELGKKFAAEWAGVFKAHSEEVPRYWPAQYHNVPYIPRQIVRRYNRTTAYSRLKGTGQK